MLFQPMGEPFVEAVVLEMLLQFSGLPLDDRMSIDQPVFIPNFNRPEEAGDPTGVERGMLDPLPPEIVFIAHPKSPVVIDVRTSEHRQQLLMKLGSKHFIGIEGKYPWVSERDIVHGPIAMGGIIVKMALVKTCSRLPDNLFSTVSAVTVQHHDVVASGD